MINKYKNGQTIILANSVTKQNLAILHINDFYRINLTNKEYLNITNQLLGEELENLINTDLVNYYFTPGNIYNLVKFAEQNNYNLSKLDLKNFLKIIIKENPIILI